jgi:hypothetical protein
MSKLRVKVPGCMRSMHGAETFCAIGSCLATATRHGIGWTPSPARPKTTPGSRARLAEDGCRSGPAQYLQR